MAASAARMDLTIGPSFPRSFFDAAPFGRVQLEIAFGNQLLQPRVPRHVEKSNAKPSG